MSRYLPVMDHVSVHRDFWTVENWWFVHIVPSVKVFIRTDIVLELELLCPPLSRLWACKIDVSRVSRPAPAVEIIAVRLFDKNSGLFCSRVDFVVIVYFDMRIDNLVCVIISVPLKNTYRNEFSALCWNAIDHFQRFFELVLIPSKVALALSMLDIKPNAVTRNVMGIKIFVDFTQDQKLFLLLLGKCEFPSK